MTCWKPSSLQELMQVNHFARKRYGLPLEDLPVNIRLSLLRKLSGYGVGKGGGGKAPVHPCPGHSSDMLFCELCETVDNFNLVGSAGIATTTDKMEGEKAIALTINADNDGAYLNLPKPIPFNSGWIFGMWLKNTKVANNQEFEIILSNVSVIGAYMDLMRLKIDYTNNNFIFNVLYMKDRPACTTARLRTINYLTAGRTAWHWVEIMHPEVVSQHVRGYVDGGTCTGCTSLYDSCQLDLEQIYLRGRYQNPVEWRIDYIRVAPKSYGEEYPPT